MSDRYLLPPVTLAQLMTLWSALNSCSFECGEDESGRELCINYNERRMELLKLLSPIVGIAFQEKNR